MSLSNTAAATAPHAEHAEYPHPAPSATSHSIEPAREEIKPPEHRAIAPPAAEQPHPAHLPAAEASPMPTPHTVASEVPAAAVNHHNVKVLPAVKSQAEVKLFATLLPHLDGFEEGMKLSISSEITDFSKPDGDALKISLIGPMVDANAASIQRILNDTLRAHTPVGSLLKAGMAHTFGHTVNGAFPAHSSIDFQLTGITAAQYAQLIQALAADAPAVAPANTAAVPIAPESIATSAPHPAAAVAAATTAHAAGCACQACVAPQVAANENNQNPATVIGTPAAHAPLVNTDRVAAL